MKEQKLEQKQSLEGKKLNRIKLKIIVLNVVNLLLLFSLFFILSRLPKKAEEVKQLRSKSFATQNESDAGVLKAELEKNQQTLDSIAQVFVDENRFLSFYSSISVLQQTGVISNLNLPVTSPVLDSNKNRGLPVSMIIKGSQAQVNEVLSFLNRLPYILRPVNVDMDVSLEKEITLRYGGFLYTDENFSKN